MLVVFSPIFVVVTKIIFGYSYVAPLTIFLSIFFSYRRGHFWLPKALDLGQWPFLAMVKSTSAHIYTNAYIVYNYIYNTYI